MIYNITAEELHQYLDNFFNEKGAGSLNQMRKSMVEQCLKSSTFRETMQKNNLWIENLLDEFEEWLKPRIRTKKISSFLL